MSEEEEVIIIKPKLIDNWRDGWKFYTNWIYAVLIGLPDLYNLAAPFLNAEGMPTGAGWTLRILAVAGIGVRFINQKKPKG